MADIDRQYQLFKAGVDKKHISDARRAELLTAKYEELQETIDPYRKGSRMWKLANQYIFGCDANDRMARTSKMNMIMHGDGHGGVHHHDGFINVNGIFEGRFDIVLTNPPFGANVEESDVVLESDVTVSEEIEERYEKEYGEIYKEAIARVKAARGKPIASLFDLPKSGRVKTEILFIERCLALLKPGGRLGIVLTEGVFNNPSLAYVREFCEERAFIRAVISLPEETFSSSGTTVKASLLFLQKFTKTQQAEFNAKHREAHIDIAEAYSSQITAEAAGIDDEIDAAKSAGDTGRWKALQKESAEFHRRMTAAIAAKTQALLKEQFSYPIFLYEAEKVGISGTGDEDVNELCRYPKDNLPAGVTKSCLEQYEEFRRNAKALPFFEERVIGIQPFARAFRICFKNTYRRWDPGSFCVLNWKWQQKNMALIGSVLLPRREKVDRSKVHFQELQPLTIHFDGSVEKRSVPEGKEYSMQLFYAKPGDLVVSKIDLKNGAVGIVPDEWDNIVATGHFAVYEIDKTRIRPAWLLRIIQQPDFKQYLWRNKVGAEGRKEVKLDFFESIKIPVPNLATQDSVLEAKQSIVAEIQRLHDLLKGKEIEIDAMIHGVKTA